jgi:hypothetical protein
LSKEAGAYVIFNTKGGKKYAKEELLDGIGCKALLLQLFYSSMVLDDCVCYCWGQQ